MFRKTDETGTVVFADYIPRYSGMDIFITLPNEKHRRHIARINFENKTLYIKRDSQSHVLKSANAYGFNHFVLSTGQKFERMVLIETDTNKVYSVQTKYILDEGQFLHFKKNGLEKQIFVTREWLSYYQVTNKQEVSLLINGYSKSP